MLQNRHCGKYLSVASRDPWGGGKQVQLCVNPDALTSQWRVSMEKVATSALLGIDGRFSLAALPDHCLDAVATHNGAVVLLTQRKVKTARTSQIWQHRPDGRICLLACPELCLSADVDGQGGRVHLAQRSKDHRCHINQIWKAGEKGTIAQVGAALLRARCEHLPCPWRASGWRRQRLRSVLAGRSQRWCRNDAF